MSEKDQGKDKEKDLEKARKTSRSGSDSCEGDQKEKSWIRRVSGFSTVPRNMQPRQ